MAARGFSLTAEINLRGPTNIRPIVNNIRRQLGSINANVNLNINRTTLGSIRQVNTSLGTLNTTLAATTSATTSAAQAFTNLAAAMRSVGNVNLPQTVQAPMVRLASSANNASAAVSRTRTEFEDFGRQAGLAVRRFAAFSAVTSVIYGFSNALSAGIKQYIEFDRQITRLSQVTNESKASLSSMTSEITRLSTSMGVASEDLAQVSVTLAQAGFTAADTRKALEALAKSALAPSFDNLNQTVEGSIALMRQFGITANQLEGALGSINAVAAGFAVEASDLIAAIQRTGGVFASSSRGVSSGTDALNEFLAVFTSIRATTRESAETIATGLRTIFTRIQRGDTIEALKEYGVQLTDLEGKFVGPYVAVQRLAEGLGRLDPRDLKFSQIVEELGGFRQIGKVLPLIQQFATAQDALKIAQQGQGSLATDAAKGQLALAVQIQKVREEFTALVRSVGDSDGFKTMVRLGLDLASALIKIADATKGVLPLIGIMAAFRGVSALTQFAGGFGGGFRGTRRADGGRIYGFARGGIVPGSGNTDSVPAMLTPGEFVMTKQTVNKYGRGNLVRMNKYSQGRKVVDDSSTKQKAHIGADIFLSKKQIQNYANNYKNKKFIAAVNQSGYTIDEVKAGKFNYEILKSNMQLKAKEKIVLKLPSSYNQALKTNDPDLVSQKKLMDYLNNAPNVLRLPSAEQRKNKQQISEARASLSKMVGRLPANKYKDSDQPNTLAFDHDNELNPLASVMKQYFESSGVDLMFRAPLQSAVYRKKNEEGKRIGRPQIRRQDRTSAKWTKIGKNTGGIIQLATGGVSSKPKNQDVFGTGETKFPRRITNVYAKQLIKEQQEAEWKTLATNVPTDERIVIDDQAVASRMTEPFDRAAFLTSFKGKVKRDSLLKSMGDFAKFIGLPQEDLSVALPMQIDFGNSGNIGRKVIGGGLFNDSPLGSRGAEGWDLSTFGYADKDKQDLFGYEKLVEEKKKLQDKILKTPVETFDDGSFSYDREAFVSVFDEIKTLQKKISDIKGKERRAIEAAVESKKQTMSATGRGSISLGTAFEKPGQDVLYHELTHQLFSGLRARSAESFTKYKDRVDLLFNTDNDGLADAFDALSSGNSGGYTSADVVYGRKYKQSLLESAQIQNIRLRDNPEKRNPELEKELASYIKASDSAKKAREYRPINPGVNQTLLSAGFEQAHIARTEDNGKEEFLTTLVQKAPVLDSNLQSVLDTTLTELLGSAGIKRQQYKDGGVAQRRVGYIDYDVIANPANESVVAKGMASTGIKGPRLYADKLTELAVSARKSASIDKLRAIYGVAGSGKTTLARGQGTDDAKLRKTERFPILTPEDIQRANEILILSSSVSNKKMDEFFGDVDRAYILSSTTKAERENVRSQRASRDATGVGLEGRTPGVTSSVAADTAVGEALLGDRLGDKSVVLGRTQSGRFRQKKGNELVETIKKKIGFTWGGFSPMTAGHESIMDAAAAMGIPPEDFIYLVGANEAIKAGDPSTYRTAIFDQDARVMMAKAGAGAKGATILPKPRDFEVPQAFDISPETGRRKVLLPGKGSTTFVADKTPEQTAKYKDAGYKVANIERTEGISGTMVRDLIAKGDLNSLKNVLSSGVYDLVSKNIGQIQNRANILPSIIEQVERTQGAELDDIAKQIKSVGISRIDKKKMSDPEYAAKVATLEELRDRRDKIKSSASFTPYKLLEDLARSKPEKYGLKFVDGGWVERMKQQDKEKLKKDLEGLRSAMVFAGDTGAYVPSYTTNKSGSYSPKEEVDSQELKERYQAMLKFVTGKELKPLQRTSDYDEQELLDAVTYYQGGSGPLTRAMINKDFLFIDREEEYFTDDLVNRLGAAAQYQAPKKLYSGLGRGQFNEILTDTKIKPETLAKNPSKTASRLAGKTVDFPTFLSTSTNASIAESFVGKPGALMSIDASNSKQKVIDILQAKQTTSTGSPQSRRLPGIDKIDPSKLASYDAEDEVVLNPNTKFKIKSAKLRLPSNDDEEFDSAEDYYASMVGSYAADKTTSKTKTGTDLKQIKLDLSAQMLNRGGAVQKFADAGAVKEAIRIRDRVSALAQTKQKSIQETLIEQLKGLGGPAGVRTILGIGSGDSVTRSVLNANNIKANKGIETAKDYVNRALFTSGKSDASEAKRIAGLTPVAIAGLLPTGYSDTNEWQLPESGKTIFATIKGFNEKYLSAAQQMSRETSVAARNLAENMQYADIFDGGKLAFDFDETLVSGADILNEEGKPDIPRYSDRTVVEEYLKRGRLTRLGTKLKTSIDADPEFIKNTRILTARPASTVDLLARSLQNFGLPYQASDITGVGGEGVKVPRAKAQNLAQTEKLIDDNLDNIRAVRKSKKSGFLYTEPQAKPELDELMGQGNIEGAVVEKALAILGANLPPIETLEANRAVDFPGGLGRAAQFFGLPDNIPTEVKRTLNGSAFEKARGEFDRYYKEQAIGLSEGGTVPALVSNGEAYVPPKLAKRIGYGKLNKMNQADRSGMGRFADGGISVFKGPGTGTSDSIPASLPVGSFILREKATKALGLNRGGAVGVQRFVFGGGPSARPDTISPETIGATGTTVTALRQLSKVLEELGVTSSRSAQLLARGYQATAAEAQIAYRADLNMARAAGASAEVIYDLERALKNSQEQAQREISIRQSLANFDGGNLQQVLSDADTIIGNLTNRDRAAATGRGLTGDELEAEVRSGAEQRRREAFEKAGGATLGIDLRTMGANGSDLERVINVLMRDAKTLEQMNQTYIQQRRAAVALERQNAGDAAAAARARSGADQDLEDAIKREIQARNDSIRDVAQEEGSADRGIRETDRNMGFMASAAIISVGSIIASNLNVKSSSSDAGIAAGIQSGSSTFGTGYGFSNEIGRFADSLERVGGSAAQFGSRLLRFGSGLTLATTGIFAVVDSVNAYQNAVNEFNLDLAKKKFEQSLSGFQEELDKTTKNTALTLDVLNSKIESASERYTKVLDTLGKQTTATWSNLLQRLGDRLGFSKIDPRDLAKESRIRELGGADAADRATLSDDARRVEYDAIIPQIAQEQAALGKAQAEAALNLLRTRLQRGESSDDVINSPQFDSISNLLANSNQSIREQLLRIENSGLDDATIAQQKKELIAQYGKEQILLEATIVKRENDSKSMSVLTSVYTRSLSRMFDNMSQAISSTNFALKELTDNADLTAKALSGQAQAGNINLKTIDVLRNPRGYNRFEQESAINGAAGFFGTRADIMPGLLGGAEAAQATIMSTINDTLEKNAGANNETIGRAIDANLRTVFANLALPPELADKLAKEVGLTVADLRQNDDDVIDFSLLTEKISSLGRVMESFQGAQNSAIEAVQAYQNVLNIYTQQTNDLIELSVSQRQKERQASDILISAYSNLQRTLGQSINLQDSQNRLATRVQGFTGQAETDPGVIFNRVLQLNRQREVAESGRRTAGERNLGGIDDFTKFNKDLEQSSVALRENYQALKFLAENTEYAADAMSKIQDAQQKIGGRVSFIEKIVTSTPEELDNLGSAVNRLQRNMNGQLNTMNSSVGAQKAYNEAIRNGANAAEAMKAAQMAFANERKDTLGALNDLLPFLGSGRETNNIRANVLESMLRESGMGVSPMFAQVLNSLRNPETDPETAAAIEYYNEANNLQAEANKYLAKIENELAKDKAAVQAQALIDGLKAVTLKFESQELKDLNANINRLVPIQPQAKAQGGVIYAAAGQMVDFRSRGTDTVPAMLTPGEFVVNRSATQKHLPLLQSINSNKYSAGGKVRYYADGGYVHNFIKDKRKITKADQSSQEKIIDFTDENAKTAFDMNYKKELYSIPAQFTFINPDKQLPETDDNTLDPDMTKLKPSNGQVVPGIGPAYYLRRQDPVFGTPSFGYNPVNPTVTSKKVVSNTEILPPDITPKHIKQTEFDQWKKAAGSSLDRLMLKPTLPTDFVIDYPSLTDFAGLFQKDKFQSTLTDATKILGITDITGSAGNLRKEPEQGYRIWEQRTTLDNANAIAQGEPIFNDGPYAGQDWHNRIPGQTALRTESKSDIVGKQYETLIASLKDRYKIYKDTVNFAKNPLYQTDVFPPGVQALLDKLATVYAETRAFVMFGNEGGAEGIDLNTYFDELRGLAGTKPVKSLMVFKPNDKALKEAVELYDQRPDLAQNVLVGWKGAGVAAKDYITNKELEISGWGNMNHLKAKEFPWILNGEIEHLPEETKKEMEENVKDQNPGDIKVRLKTTNGKMPIPGMSNILPQFNNEKIDFTYAYDEWIGKLYDPTTRTFEPNVVPQPLLLPQNIKGSIFEESNLDINKYRFMGSDQFSLNQIVPDLGKDKDLTNYYSAIINNNDAEKQRLLPNLKGAFKYQWNNRRWIGASFGAIPALNKDLDDAKANPVDITTFILKQAENLLTNLGAKAGQADTGFAKLRSSNIPDNELPSVVRNLSKGALRLFGSRNIPGFAKNWLYSDIGRVPFMQNMNPAFAKNVSQNISGVLDQAGGRVDNILSNGNWNPRVYDYLKETWTLLAGASKAFAGLGSGNTRFIAQIRDLGQDTGIMDLFRSMGGGVALGQLMGLSLNQNWENLVENALQDSKMKQIGAGGTLSPIQEAPKNVKDLINFIFNPYNEFGVASSRTNLIDSFITDLFNYRGNNPMMGGNFGANPMMDRATMAWIKERSDILKTWYGGDGNQWVGQDYFYDKNLEPDDTDRIREFDRSWWVAGKDYYDMANRAHIELGLGDKFGPIPRQDWFATRAAQGFQTGGVVYAQTGGHMVNFQPRGTDTVPAMLTPGEFVVNRSATQKHLPLLTAINDGVQPYNVGGVVYAQTGGKLSLRRELPSTKPRPQVIDPKDIPDVEIPEPVVKTPEQPKRGSGGRTYGSLDMGFGSGSIEYDGNNQQKLGRSKSPRNYGPIDMQGLEIDNEAPSVDGRNNNKGKQGIPPPFIRKHISPTAKSLGGIVYAQTGGIVYAQDGGGVSPRNKVATAMHRQRQKEISEFNQLMLDAQLAQRELEILLFGPSKETKYLLKNTIFDNDQNMLGLYESMSKLRSQKAPPAILDYTSAQAAQANQGLQEIAEINKVLRLVAGRDKKYGTFDDNNSGLTELSMALSAMSIGTPVVADLANIPVDLLRGDVDSAMMSAASAGLDIFGGYGGAGIAAAKTAKMTAGLGLFGTILGKSKLLTRDTVENTLKNSWKGKIGDEVIDDFYKSIGKGGAADKVKEAYEKALEAFYTSTTSAKSPEAIFEAADIFNRTALPGSGRLIGSTKTADISAVTAGQLAGMLKNRSGIGGIVKYGAEKLANVRKLLIDKKTLVGGAVAALGVAAWQGGPGARIRRGGEVGPAVGTPDNIRLPAAPVPDGALTPAEIVAQNAIDQKEMADIEAKRLANKAERRETLLRNLTKKDANGIPQLVADAYNMVKDRGRFLGRFSSKTLTREQALNPSLEVLKSNIHEDRTVQNVLDHLEDDEIADADALKTKFLDNDDYYARGGVVYANQGMLIPYAPRGTDTVPAMLTPGEFVVNRAATQQNLPLLKAINNGSQAYAKGGVVYAQDGGETSERDRFLSQLETETNRKQGLSTRYDARTGRTTLMDPMSGQVMEDNLSPYNKDLGSADPLKAFGIGAAKSAAPTAAGIAAGSYAAGIAAAVTGPAAPIAAPIAGLIAGVGAAGLTALSQEGYLDFFASQANAEANRITSENPLATNLGGTLPGLGAGLAQQGLRSFVGTLSQRAASGTLSSGLGAGMEYATTGTVDLTNLGMNFGVGFAQPNTYPKAPKARQEGFILTHGGASGLQGQKPIAGSGFQTGGSPGFYGTKDPSTSRSYALERGGGRSVYNVMFPGKESDYLKLNTPIKELPKPHLAGVKRIAEAAGIDIPYDGMLSDVTHRAQKALQRQRKVSLSTPDYFKESGKIQQEIFKYFSDEGIKGFRTTENNFAVLAGAMKDMQFLNESVLRHGDVKTQRPVPPPPPPVLRQKGGIVYAAEGGEFPKNRVRQLEKDAEDRIQGGLAADEARRQKIEDAIEQRNRERDAVAYKPRSDLRNSKPLDQDLYDFDNANSWRIYTDDAFVNRGLHPGSYWGAALTPEDLVASAPSYEQRRLKTLIRAGKLAHEEGATTKDKEDQNARQQILDQIYQNRDAATSKLERISTGKDIGAVDETDPQKLYQRYEQTALDRFLQWYFYKSKANAGESQRDFLKRTRSGWDSDFDFDNPYNINNVVTRSKGESEERFVEELTKQGLNAVEAFEKYPALPKKFLSTLEFATINNLSDSQRESLFSMEDQMDPGMEALNIAIQQMIDDKNKRFAEAQKARAKAVADKAAQSRPQSKASAAVDPGMKMFSQIAERRWEDSTGQHSTIGTLQELIGDKVRIAKLNGKTTLMPVSQLGTADQNYIRELQEVRNWTDDTGKYKTQARVIGVGKQGIMIQKLDGSTKNVPMNRLSKQDQDYLYRMYPQYLNDGASFDRLTRPVQSSITKSSLDPDRQYYGAQSGVPAPTFTKGAPPASSNETDIQFHARVKAAVRELELQDIAKFIAAYEREGLPILQAERTTLGYDYVVGIDGKTRVTVPFENLDTRAKKLRTDLGVSKLVPFPDGYPDFGSDSNLTRIDGRGMPRSLNRIGTIIDYNFNKKYGTALDIIEEYDRRGTGMTPAGSAGGYGGGLPTSSDGWVGDYYGVKGKPSYRQYGGPIYASNGTLVNYQPRGTDTVPAMLTPGEFVVNRAATQKHLPLLKSINSGGGASGFSDGGIVYLAAGGSAPNHQSVVDNFNNKLLSVASNKKQSDLLYEIKDSSITSNKQLNQVQNKNIPDILKNANNGFSSVGGQLKDINQANMAVQKAITNTNRRSDISNNNTPQDIYTDAITTVNSTSSLDENSSSKPDYSKYAQPIYASNGTLVNYQPRGTDTVPAMLTPGEFVVNRQAAQKNLPLLQAINSNNYSRGGVVYMAAAGLVPMTPGELEREAANNTRNRRGQPPLNRQQQQQQQQQARDQKKQAEAKRKRFLSLSPMMKMLVQEINNQRGLYETFNADAINEGLQSNDIIQKVNEKIKDVGDPGPAGTAQKQKIFMDRGISDFNRFNQLMRWHTNSKKLLETNDPKLNDAIGEFVNVDPAKAVLSLKDILTPQKDLSIIEAAAIRDAWISLAQNHGNLFNGMSPEQIINGIITTATKPKAFNNGGVVYANNGMLIPYRPKGTDTVPAMLTPGEFVVNRESTRQNLGLLRAINSNSYANGGVVKYLSEGTAGGLSFTKILSSFTSGIQRAAAAIDTLLTTLQNTSGGVNNDGGSVSVGGLDGLGQFTAKFDQFITQLSKLNLPPEININGNHKVEVVINGAQALQSLLDGPLSGLIRREVQSAFSRLNAESEGSIPDPTKQ